MALARRTSDVEEGAAVAEAKAFTAATATGRSMA
jgi:hypothetical protein